MDIQNKKECLQQYQYGLQHKIYKLIIFISIGFYCVYLLTQFCYTIATLKSLEESEKTYLSTLASDLAISIQNDHKATLHYITTTQTQMKFSSSGVTTVCSDELFLCDESTSSDYSSFELSTKYMKANSAMLSQINIHRIFVIKGSSTIFFNHSAYGLPLSANSSQIIGNITEIYYHTITALDNRIQEEKELSPSLSLLILCSYSQGYLMCVSSFKDTVQYIQNTQNAFFVKQFVANMDYDNSLEEFVDKISTQQIIFQSFGRQKLIDCVGSYSNVLMNFIDVYKGFEVHCRSDKSYILNFFGHFYLFYAYLQESLEAISQIKNGVAEYDLAREWVVVSSNTTYYENNRKIKGEQLKNIRVTSYIFIVFSALALFILSRSRVIIEEYIILSLQIIKALSDLLKNGQEKEFTRLLGRGNPPILYFIVQYFKKFLWIQVLRKCKRKNKYKKLLVQGLQLFEEQQYVPVLKYIYCQLITLESSSIEKLSKVKELPHKRKQVGSKLQDQQKPFPLAAEEPKASKRRNANIQLLNPDDDQLMKNISIGFRQNRGVRFSNDIQMIEIDQGPILRKAKFAQSPLVSCQTIKNDLSDIDNCDNESMKRSDGNKQTVKSLKSQQESYTSLVQMSRGSRKRQSLARSRSLQNIHLDLDNLKLDEQQEEDQLLAEQQSQEDQIFNMGRDQITFVIAETYERLIHHYDKLLQLLRKQVGVSNEDETSELATYIYRLTIRKYQRFYDMLLYQKENQIQRSVQQAGFEDLTNLQQTYNQYFTNQLTQQAQLLKMSILQALKHPIPLQSLKDVYSKSKCKKIQIAARHLIALAAEQFHPHLDSVLIKNIFANLSEEHTTNRVKQDSLRVLTRKLQRYACFWVELQELKMVQQFYNTRHRKFYFLASLSNIKPCTPALSKFYELLDNFDIFSVYNLDEDGIDLCEHDQGDNKQRRKLNSDKIKYLTDLEGFLQQFNFNNERIRQGDRSSVHTIGRKRAYEKQLHQLLMAIQADEVQYCKYVVVFLGEQHNGSSGQTQQSSSSASHRTQQQKMHQEITKNIEKGFFHFILIGFHLSVYPSKYGRLKRYIKLSPQILQLEISPKEQSESLKRLEKYLR